MPYSYPISVVVGTAGATIVGEDGFKLIIPQNALTQNTTITIAAPITAPSLRGMTMVSRSYGIGPDGLSLAHDATIYVPYFSQYESQRSSIVVYLASDPSEPDPTGWVPTPQDFGESGKMGGTTSHLHSALAAI
ncbi:MAG: hypothetical protein HY902_05755 [Deltaproteobacteria bacterium]|nr:hypothetical protein [Deltaproteobacteria bacterium]